MSDPENWSGPSNDDEFGNLLKVTARRSLVLETTPRAWAVHLREGAVRPLRMCTRPLFLNSQRQSDAQLNTPPPQPLCGSRVV